MNTTYYKQEEIRKHAIDYLEENKEYLTCYGADLHHEIYNTDYYIIGRYRAKQWLADQVFDTLNVIKKYEQDNFGELNTDICEPENVVNMYVYIVGQEVLQNSDTLQDNWDNKLNPKLIKKIINELKQ